MCQVISALRVPLPANKLSDTFGSLIFFISKITEVPLSKSSVSPLSINHSFKERFDPFNLSFKSPKKLNLNLSLSTVVIKASLFITFPFLNLFNPFLRALFHLGVQRYKCNFIYPTALFYFFSFFLSPHSNPQRITPFQKGLKDNSAFPLSKSYH